MTTNTTKKIPHKHAELIKLWADGHAIQYKTFTETCWHDSTPLESLYWGGPYEFRIKPREFPVTSLTNSDLCSLYYNGGYVSQQEEVIAWKRVANAAIKQYILDEEAKC